MSDSAHASDWSFNEPVSAEVAFAPATGRLSVSVVQGSLRLRNSRLKRLIDVIGASLGLVILAPFLLFIAFTVSLESRGPVFFRQRRSGLDGRQFLIYKFRTMRVMEDGENVTQATRADCRVTRFGKFLRRSSFDELPQLINVIKGEMSLVGPRPHAVAHDEYYLQAVPDYHLRFQATPGITGLAQVAGFRGEVRDVAHMGARVAKDVEYIGSWSLALDIKILLRTILTGSFHEMAY